MRYVQLEEIAAIILDILTQVPSSHRQPHLMK